MSLFGRNVALLAVLGIALVVLFPATFGPFPVTYGPASALRAIAYATLLLLCLSVLPAVLTESPMLQLQQNRPTEAVTGSLTPPTLALRC
jgi:hypothetical protein